MHPKIGSKAGESAGRNVLRRNEEDFELTTSFCRQRCAFVFPQSHHAIMLAGEKRLLGTRIFSQSPSKLLKLLILQHIHRTVIRYWLSELFYAQSCSVPASLRSPADSSPEEPPSPMAPPGAAAGNSAEHGRGGRRGSTAPTAPGEPKAPLPPASLSFSMAQPPSQREHGGPRGPGRAAGPPTTLARQRRRSGDRLTTTSSKMLCSCVSMGTMGIAMGPGRAPPGPLSGAGGGAQPSSSRPAGSSVPDPAPQEATARPGRSGRHRPPRPDRNGGKASAT